MTPVFGPGFFVCDKGFHAQFFTIRVDWNRLFYAIGGHDWGTKTGSCPKVGREYPW
jgi:hypothetical protein